MEQYGAVATAILEQAGYNHGDVGHSVVDSDGYFVIDPKTKEITGESKSITQFDHESEIISFKLPRYVEGHDMSVCTNVEVHYNNISTSRQENAGIYDVTDLAVMADDENMVQFTWLISENATQYDGLLSFLIMFKCERNGEVEYRWSTHINSSDLTVAKGMNNGSVIVAEYADILVQWEQRLFSAEDSAINNIEAKADETEARMTHFSEETYDSFNRDVNKKMSTMSGYAQQKYEEFSDMVDEKAEKSIEAIPEDYAKLDANVKRLEKTLQEVENYDGVVLLDDENNVGAQFGSKEVWDKLPYNRKYGFGGFPYGNGVLPPFSRIAGVFESDMMSVRGGKGRWNGEDTGNFEHGGHVFEGWNAEEDARLTAGIGLHNKNIAWIQTFHPATEEGTDGGAYYCVTKIGSDLDRQGVNFMPAIAKAQSLLALVVSSTPPTIPEKQLEVMVESGEIVDWEYNANDGMLFGAMYYDYDEDRVKVYTKTGWKTLKFEED